MRRLLLLRHAKSSWDEPDVDDHDRPLNARGRLAAPLMGAWLGERGDAPDHVLASSSRRTLETWERARVALPGAPDAEIRPRLYHADPATMLEEARSAPDEARTLLLIGHQPGVGAFARALSNGEAPAHCARAYTRFPTAACAVFDVEAARWAELAFGTARFVAFAVPREIV